MSFDPHPQEYLRQLKDEYEERRKDEFQRESATVLRYFEAVAKRLETTYTFDKVLAVGGTGIVHTGHHKRFTQPVVLKINRPNIEPEATSMVEQEADVLPTLTHPNIVRVLDLGKLCDHEGDFCACGELSAGCVHSAAVCAHTPKLTYVVEPYITGSMPLFTHDKERVHKTWLYEQLTHLKDLMPDALELGQKGDTSKAIGLINSLLGDIAALFSQWVSLLSHVHSKHEKAEHGYVYLDVKPENVLVDEHLHLTSIDYGSVEPLDPTNQTPIEVFFTERYAHQELIKRIKDKASSNRVRGGIKRSELRYGFDYYALGMSILEILNEIALIRPHAVPQLPLYRSLHFLATRLLDGQNSGRPSDNIYPYASQVFTGLRDSDYDNLRYEGLDQTYRDLEKERGRWSLEEQVPELATFSKDIVRLVPGYNTVLTPRLRGVIEHPLVARLKYVTQLGLVSLVYPTADHSRYDHALGSYTYTTYYVKSLFNDLGNPLFRNLVETEDLNAVLLAALLHDLGQYPLAHDLEEVHDRIFKHGLVGRDLLNDPMPDRHGRTLLEIIEDPQNGWNVRADTLRRILRASSKNLTLAAEEQKSSLKTSVLAAIIDGQVDADKADYIIRDSVRCELPYGAQLDLERLLRVLTVAIIPGDAQSMPRVTLGVYDKGLVSAHAFGQARYELFATVYWHHTSRIIKAMLQYATTLGLPREVFGPSTPQRDNQELQIRERLLGFLKSLVPPFENAREQLIVVSEEETEELDLVAEPPEQVIAVLTDEKDRKRKENFEDNDWYPGIGWTDWLMLRWITTLPDASDQCGNLIHGIQTRRLYKRVATFSRGGPHEELIRKLDELQWPDRVDLSTRLHEHVRRRVSHEWGSLNTATTMTENDFENLAESHLLVLIDIPNPLKKMGYDRPLGLVPELKEKSYQQDSRQASEDIKWRDIMKRMMEGIGPVRVLCHPDIRNIIGSLYAPVETSLAGVLNDLL